MSACVANAPNLRVKSASVKIPQFWAYMSARRPWGRWIPFPRRGTNPPPSYLTQGVLGIGCCCDGVEQLAPPVADLNLPRPAAWAVAPHDTTGSGR